MNDLINKNIELFHFLHPCLRNIFYKLCTDGKIGLIPVSINKIGFQKTNLLDKKYAYNFKIQVPYALKTLFWEILFNPEDLYFAPDFDFNDETFPATLDVNEISELIPTLLNWDLENSECLQDVLKEFLNLYKKAQIEELKSNNIYSRISDEYQLLMTVPDISPNDVELAIENNTIQVVVSIKVELSNLPEYIQEMNEDGSLLNPKEDFALLFIHFHKLDASQVSTHLQLSPRLDQLIGNINGLHIPTYEKESSMVEYVPYISNILQQLINEVAFQCQFRKEFVTSLVALRRKSIIEYDSLNFGSITFLCEVENFYVLIHILIGEEFPREKPVVKLKSIYCTNPKTKLPCEKVLEYRYIKNQCADEMAKYVLDQLKKCIPEFKLHSHVKILQ